MLAVKEIVRAAVDGNYIGGLIDDYRRESGESFSEVSDRLMVALAEEFLDGRLTYGDADRAANTWWALMCDRLRLQQELTPDLAYSIFGAFDEGEYDHGDGLDPVSNYTIPLLRSALNHPSRDGRR